MANKNGSLTPSVFYLKRASLCDEVRQIYVSLFSLLGNLFNHFTSDAAYYLSSNAILKFLVAGKIEFVMSMAIQK